MKLLFEKSTSGRCCYILPECDVPQTYVPTGLKRALPLNLPEMAETDISRHYTELCHNAFGVNCGFYPLGSCTMKYNPRINEEIAAMPEFTDIHPLQPAETVKGCKEVLETAEKYLCEITGMDAMTFQPAAGAHGEFTGLLLIKSYHLSRNDTKRKKIIVPDSAHGTNPASASMVGFEVVSVPSGKDGCVDLEKLSEALDENTAGLMLTNPNTVGLFDKNILKITEMVHKAGGLTYYDGANLNAVMGVARPGDMGFDVVHINLHKTFSTPHGGGGPGSGPVGCKATLKEFLPECRFSEGGNGLQVKSFYGNFLVVVKALTYILTLGAEGIREASSAAVLNANYLMSRLSETYELAYKHPCMHEFVMTLESLKKETGVSALDIAKSLIDRGIHPPTMYFPLIVHEALMFEPTETESPETLDKAAEVLLMLYKNAYEDSARMHEAPLNAPIRRPDEVLAARTPVLKYSFVK
jgi:glycine dehydrogenase subunit 2